MSVPVVLVGGLHGPARAALVDRLLREYPGAVAVHHDLRGVTGGMVIRTVRSASLVLDRAVVRLEHGCVSCTTREDLVPQLLRYAERASLLVAELWDCVEPRSVAEALDDPAWRDELRLTSVLTALDPELTPSDICRGERLADVGRPGGSGDERYLAEVLARQIEYATGLVLPRVLPDPIPPADDDDLALCREILGHLAPMTPVTLPDEPLPPLTGPALCTRELAERVDPATAQLPCEARTPAVDTVVWHRTRPLHPGRFFDAMDELATDTVRSRGRFWLANRPDRMLAWDAVAGIVMVEDTGPWLACLPEAAWDAERPARRLAAALDWSPDHGDRVQHLVFTGPDLDDTRLHALLDSCLLHPNETVAEPDDPFAAFLDVRESA
ncbi:CobW family GTP-binding protein [Thermomonospora umbrina]|uniref:G3E family GTPase n=1 Tax=Thermomonospora umbrina TaxID=111806 RepID=A0A3D9T1X1_9ACTN|nr:GTP-binding protein [Thermomonospora umbrina]REE97821.1 G3E family GTPase [Thermomonospora umbrina]